MQQQQEQQHLTSVGVEHVDLGIEKTTTTTNQQLLFRYIIRAATNFCSRIVVFLYIPIRFAFIASSAILTLSSQFAIQSNRSASRRNSSKTINRIKIEHTRDRFEVYASMLEAAINGGIKKSDILYEAYPDPRDFNAYMQHLVQNALLIKEEYHSRTNGNGYYITSNKGFVYIELYRELERLCPSLMIYVSN